MLVYFKELLGGRALRSISLLLGGGALAQIISIVSLPILSRIYLPSEFGIFAVFLSVVTLVSVVACLRFDVAISLPKSDKESRALFVLSCFFTAVVSFLTLGVVLGAGSVIEEYALYPVAWWMPLAILCTSLFSACQFYANKQRQFKDIAKARLLQASVCVLAQFFCGLYLGGSGSGLVIGYLFGCLFGAVFLFYLSVLPGFRFSFGFYYLVAIFKKYQKFPRYSVWESLANSAGVNLSLVFIAFMSGGADAGFFMMAMKLLGAPMSLLGGAVGQVYLSEASIAERVGELKKCTKKFIINLFKFGVGSLVFFSIVALKLVPYVLGSEWVRVGEVIIWMIPWFALQLIASPVSMIVYIKERQELMLALTVFGLIIRLGSVFFTSAFMPGYVLEIYAVASAIFYLACMILVLSVAQIGRRELFDLLVDNFHVPLLLSGLGCFLFLIF